jgi:hypothetical protein
MVCPLQDIEKIAERLRASFGNPTVSPPSVVELKAALESLRKMVGKHALVDEISHALRQRKLILSPQMADSFCTLVALAKRITPTRINNKTAIEYQPNHISLEDRWSNLFFAAVLLLYGSYSINIDDFYVPLSRRREFHLHGVSAWVMFGAVVCAVVVLLSTVVDHYDRRNNERHYHATADWFKTLGWCLFGTALVINLSAKFSQ